MRTTARPDRQTPLSREFAGTQTPRRGRGLDSAHARSEPVPTPPPGAGSAAAAAILGAPSWTPGPGRRHVSAASDVTGSPSPPAPDWLPRPLTRRASSSAPRVQWSRSLFTSAEKRRWRLWLLSAPWRYSCCPASPAAQVAAWPELVSGELLSHDWWSVAGRRGAGEAGVWVLFREAGGLGA